MDHPVQHSKVHQDFSKGRSDTPKAKGTQMPIPPSKPSRSRLPALIRRLATVLFLLSMTPVLILRWVNPPTSMFMLLDRAHAWTQGHWHYTIDYEWVSWSAIATPVKLAVVAAEDQHFPDHHGFDLQAIEDAMEHNLEAHTTRGGSTITQQTAKNLFLYPGRSYLRKGLEAYFTLLIELSWPKRRILEIYLNIAEFGEGVYGVGAAAQTFFGKPASRLDTREAALLAAVLPNPKRLNVDQPSAHALKRQHWIEKQMRALDEQRLLEAL